MFLADNLLGSKNEYIFAVLRESLHRQDPSTVEVSKPIVQRQGGLLILPHSGASMLSVSFDLNFKQRIGRHLLFSILTSLSTGVNPEVSLGLSRVKLGFVIYANKTAGFGMLKADNIA